MVSGAGSPEEHADPTLQLLANLTRDGTVLDAFQATHNKFRRYHVECLRLAASATSDDHALDQLLRTLDSYAKLFDEHHSAEDHYFFPALRRAEPALSPVVDQLYEQHIGLAAQLASVLAKAALIHSPRNVDDGIARLAAELTNLQAAVEEHLSFEEASTVPVVRTWRSWPV
jgi:iron-sulfur cluster repair protein YtfE (RIC family)